MLSQDGITLGSPDIESLRSTDRGMWSAVFKVATGKLSVREAVGELLQALPFDKIANLSANDDEALRFGKYPCINLYDKPVADTVAVDLGTKLLHNGSNSINSSAAGTQSHELEGEDENDDGPVLVLGNERSVVHKQSRY